MENTEDPLLYAGFVTRGQAIFDVFWRQFTKRVLVWPRGKYVNDEMDLEDTGILATSTIDAIEKLKKWKNHYQ